MTFIVYRIQDQDGRGPFRPGFSRVWSDSGDRLRPRTSLEEFPNFFELTSQAHSSGMHIGTGCRTRQGLNRWFSKAERRRLLTRHGYRLVRLMVDEVLAESDYQVLFSRRLPLSALAKAGRLES